VRYHRDEAGEAPKIRAVEGQEAALAVRQHRRDLQGSAQWRQSSFGIAVAPRLSGNSRAGG
jgi:hypothetical protein